MAEFKDQVPIWLDCDTGHDDAFAVLLAACSNDSHLLGISTVHGNASLPNTTYNTRAVLAAIQRPDIPVIAGAENPLERKPLFAPGIHGESGLDGVTLLPKIKFDDYAPSIDAAASAAATAILSCPPHTVRLVCTGPLTNIAHLIRAYPAVIDHIKAISVMGGAIGGNFTNAPLGTAQGEGERFGNSSPWAEFNIVADPEAARIVLCNEGLAPKLTLVTLDLTHKCRAVARVRDQLFGEHKIGNGETELPYVQRVFKQVLMFFADTYASVFDISDGPPLHDPLAVYAALHSDDFDDACGERWEIDVVLERDRYDEVNAPTSHTGQTVATAVSRAGTIVPRDVKLDKFWHAIDIALSNASKT